ncbi:MAG: TonB-dependent receptor, partial [Bacteroidota bacterium]
DYNGVSTHTDENGYFKLESSSVGIQFSDLGYFLDCPNCVPNKDTSGLNAQVWFLIPTEYYTLKAVQIGQNENVRGEMLSSSSSLVLLGSEGRFSFDGSSLQSAFNSIPGVQYDSRGYGGSSRISLRGSFLRSPFAVRNLKMYLNGIALTNPDGQSPLEMFDLSYLGQMEVTKGPAGALFGSGHGGVVQMQLPALARNHLMLEAGSSVGEFGYRKGFIAASGTHGKLSYGVHVNSQTTDGYRQQEWNFRENILGNLNWNGKSNQKLIFIHYRGAWGLPGALNATQVNENPTQAVSFAITNNTSVNKWRDMIAYTFDKKWGSQSIQFSANAYTSEKWNPYGTSVANSGYKNENAFGGGFRGIYGKSWKLKGEIELLSQVGSECQFEYLDFHENSLVNGTSGDLKIAFESYALNWNVFEQLSLKKGSVWSIHTSLGTNATPTVSKGTNFIADPPFQDLDSKVNYELKLYPRIGASLQLNEHLFASGNWTKGNSAPSIFEQLDYNTNSINKLASEYSSSSEIGIKSTWKFFQAGVALYNQEITNAIVVADTVIDGLP